MEAIVSRVAAFARRLKDAREEMDTTRAAARGARGRRPVGGKLKVAAGRYASGNTIFAELFATGTEMQLVLVPLFERRALEAEEAYRELEQQAVSLLGPDPETDD